MNASTRRRLLPLLFLFALLRVGLLTVTATEPSLEAASDTDTVPTEFSSLLEALPEEIRELLPDALFQAEITDVGEGVEKMSDFSYLLQAVLDTAGVCLPDCLSLLSTVLGLLLLSAVFAALRTSVKNESVGKALSLITSLTILSVILVGSYDSVQAVSAYLTNLRRVATASIPLLGALYAMGGNVTAAAASSGGLSVYLSIVEHLIEKTIVPFCGVCLAFGFINASGMGPRLSALLSTLKKHYTTLLAFLMMLLLAMLSAQTLLGASADSLAMRGAKFAIGNLIPVVGGSVSEMLRTLSAGIGYLRGALGICGILLLLLLLLPPLIRLLLYRAVWQLTASAAELLNCDTEKKLLDEIASLNGYLIAAVSISSSVLILSFALLTRCASAIG